MRKIITLLTIVLTLFIFVVPALAVPAHKATFVVGQTSYTIDGQTKSMDAGTFIENGRTYVPIRYLALALGVVEKDIIWQSPNVILKLNNIELKLSAGSNILFKNGQQINMDVSVINRNGRTYLPARWVAEAFGYEVKWQPPKVLIGHNLQEEIQTSPFPAKLIKLEMEVGSRKAVGTKPDGSKVEIILDEAPYLTVVNKENMKFALEKAPGKEIYKKYPPVIDPSLTGNAMYIPFMAVAGAFGVPEQNMEWDGKKLKVYDRPDWYGIFTPDSKKILWTGGWGTDQSAELPYPIRLKNSTIVVAIEGFRGLLFSNGSGDALIQAYQDVSDSGMLTGKPYINCNPYN